jgi:hypothetical protein
MMKIPCSEHTDSDDRYSPEEIEAQHEAFNRFEKDKKYKEYWKPSAVEARDINIHANITNVNNANEHRSNAITKAENKVREAARGNHDLFVKSENLPDFERKVDQLVRIERTRLEKLYPKRDVKYQYAYFSYEVIHFLIETILCGKTTREAYKLLQQHEGLNHAMDSIIKHYDYDIDVTEYIKIAQRRGSKHIKKVYDKFVELYKDDHKDEKHRAMKFKQATTDTTMARFQPEEMGDLYDNIRLISAVGMWGKDYKQLYTSSDSGIEGCLAKLARALKLARHCDDLKDFKKVNNGLTKKLETEKAALAVVQETTNDERPNHIQMIKRLWKEQGLSAANMLPILQAAGCYSDKNTEDKMIRSKLLDSIRQEIMRIKKLTLKS